MGQFNGKAENIENNLNKVTSVNSARTDTDYPSAKAVFEFAKTDKTYNPDSEQPQSGKAVAQAISHFDTVLKSGNTFVFDGGRPSGKFNIDLVIDSELDPESNNPLENKKIVEELSALDGKNEDNASSVNNLSERCAAVEERLTTVESFIPQYGTYTPKFLYRAGVEGETWKQAECSMDYSYGWYYKIGRLVWFSVQMKGMVTSADGMRYSGFSLPFKCVGCASFLCGECFNLHDQEIYSAIAENNSGASFQDTRGSHAAPWLLNKTGWVKASGCYLTDK